MTVIHLPCPAGCGVPVSICYTLSDPFRIHNGTFEATVQVDWDAVAPDIEAHCMADPDAHPDQFGPDCDESTPDTSRAYFLDLIARIDGTIDDRSGT